MMTVEGIARQLYPGLDIVEEIRPYFADIVGYRYSPERITSDLLHVAARFANAASEFPGRADDILEDLRQGRMSVVVRQPTLAHVSERLGRRLFHGMFAASLTLGGSWLLAEDHRLEGAVLIGVALLWMLASSIALSFGRRTPEP
jgi:predicted unusual protein kinase regulating ubiquinone biosynthesis (AarF/ABC1/UbiB family)